MPLPAAGWVIDPPRGYWIERAPYGGGAHAKVLLRHPGLPRGESVAWYITEPHSDQLPALEIDGNKFDLNVSWDDYVGNRDIERVERFEQAGLSFTKLTEPAGSLMQHVYYFAQEGERVIIFKIEVRADDTSRLAMYDAMVRTLRRAEQ